MTTYSYKVVDKLIADYTNRGGIAIQTDEGCLASGDWILTSDPSLNLYSFVIKEVYLNEWSSAQTIRKYSKLPKKYQKIVDNQ